MGEIDLKDYKNMVKRKLHGRTDITYCPKCGKPYIWQKPTNDRKFVCQKCGTESIIICPRKEPGDKK